MAEGRADKLARISYRPNPTCPTPHTTPKPPSTPPHPPPMQGAKVITSQSCSQTSPPCSFGPTIQMAGRQDHWLGERGRGTDPRRTEHPPHLVHFHIPSHGINISSLPLPPFFSLLLFSLVFSSLLVAPYSLLLLYLHIGPFPMCLGAQL